MTRRVTRGTKRSGTKRSTHSIHSKRSKRSIHSTHSKRSCGGAQGAPLDKAFSGVVLPSYVPILKPMHGGDGYAYHGANLAPNAPAAMPMKGRRGRKRSVKRKGKARVLPVGHALPPGFGQMVQSFRPL